MTIAERGPSERSGQTDTADPERTSRSGRAAAFFPDAKLVEAALEAARIGVWSWDIASDRVTWSSNLESIHQLPTGSFDGTFAFVQNDVHPDDRPQVRTAIEEALRTGDARRMLYRLPPRPDGEEYWIESRGDGGHGRTAEPSECSAPAGTSPSACICTGNCSLRASQQETVARLGERALIETDLQAFFDDTAAITARHSRR